jgi:hypothetical protein
MITYSIQVHQRHRQPQKSKPSFVDCSICRYRYRSNSLQHDSPPSAACATTIASLSRRSRSSAYSYVEYLVALDALDGIDTEDVW